MTRPGINPSFSGKTGSSNRERGSAALPAREQVATMLVSAHRHLRGGHGDFALDAFRRVLEIEPDHVEALSTSGTILMQARRFGPAIESFERAIAVMIDQGGEEDDLVTAAGCLAKCHLYAGAFDKACASLDNARAALPDTPQLRQSLAGQHFALAAEFNLRGSLDLAIVQLRRALTLHPDGNYARSNLIDVLAKTGEPARLADFTMDFAADELEPFVFITCMPKSGSSFLKAALLAFTGFAEAWLTYAYLQNEQELYLPNVIKAGKFRTVTQQHARATEANLQMMQGFGIRPIVLVRNLADVAVSLLDFYDKGADINTFFQPFWPELSREERLDVIVDHIMPWYVAFYASWVRAERGKRIELMWLRYEDMTRDKPAALADIARFYGIEKGPDEIAAAIAAAEGDRYETRFNKGVSGRGREQLNESQRGRIARLAAHYRDVDFAPVGF